MAKNNQPSKNNTDIQDTGDTRNITKSSGGKGSAGGGSGKSGGGKGGNDSGKGTSGGKGGGGRSSR